MLNQMPMAMIAAVLPRSNVNNSEKPQGRDLARPIGMTKAKRKASITQLKYLNYVSKLNNIQPYKKCYLNKALEIKYPKLFKSQLKF